MIEFAAAVWKFDVPATITRMVQEGMSLREASPSPEAIGAYVADHVQARIRRTRFYAAAVKTFAEAPPGLRALQRRFCGDVDFADWPRRGWTVMGATTRDAFEQFLGSIARAVFKGAGWDDLLVVPFYDMPGRLSGFLFLGRRGDIPADVAFYGFHPGVGNRPAEAGLGMLHAILREAAGPQPVVITDLAVAIRLQLRQLRLTGHPLPLALHHASLKHTVTATWEHLPLERVAIWSPTDTLHAISLAKDCEGSVSPEILAPSEYQDCLARKTPDEWLGHAHRDAAPWATILRRCLRKYGTDTSVVASSLARLALPETLLRRFHLGCDVALRSQLTPFLERPRSRTIQYAGATIHERDGGWYRQLDMVCDGIIRVDTVLVSPTGQSHYRGRILFRDRIVPFTEKTAALDADLLGWAARYVRDVARLGILRYDPRWARHGCGIALAFQEPTVTDRVERVGWDSGTGLFHFPAFALGPRRVTTEHPFHAGLADCPAGTIPPPETIPSAALLRLSEPRDDVAAVWAVTSVIMAAALSALRDWPRRGCLLAGAGAETIGIAVARRLGCLETLVRRHHRTVPKLVTQRCGPHHWPTLLINDGRFALRHGDWLDDAAMGLVITPVPPAIAWVAGTRERWTILDIPSGIGSARAAIDDLPLIVSNYLADVVSRGFVAADVDPVLATLADMATWFHQAGGDPAAVRAGARWLRVPTTHSGLHYLVRLVLSGYVERKLHFGRAGHGAVAAHVLYDDAADTVWIQHAAVVQWVLKKTGIALDIGDLRDLLVREGVFLAEKLRHGFPGWLIKNASWTAELDRVDKLTAGV